MSDDPRGHHLIETPAERYAREQAEETGRENRYRKLQLWFNGILAVFTVLTCGIVLYQNRILNATLIEMRTQSDALNKTLSQVRSQTGLSEMSAFGALDSAKAARESVTLSQKALASGDKSSEATIAALRSQIDAMRDTATATQSNVATTRAVQRARVHFQGITSIRRVDRAKNATTAIEFGVRWTNSGSTPTRNAGQYYNQQAFANELPSDFAFADLGNRKTTPLVVAPGVPVSSAMIRVPSEVLRPVQ